MAAYLTTIQRAGLAFSLVVLSGCITTGSGGHTFIDGHCVTCLNNPITGEAYNYSKTSPDYVQAQNYRQVQDAKVLPQGDETPYVEGLTTLSVNRDVDTVYTRIKREFGFLTRAEWERNYLYDDGGILWEAIPGVSYHMRFTVPHHFKGVTRNHYIEATLTKNGRSTDLTFKFWVQIPKATINRYAYSIKQRASRVLR